VTEVITRSKGSENDWNSTVNETLMALPIDTPADPKLEGDKSDFENVSSIIGS
jgi:hypothetical protein